MQHTTPIFAPHISQLHELTFGDHSHVYQPIEVLGKLVTSPAEFLFNDSGFDLKLKLSTSFTIDSLANTAFGRDFFFCFARYLSKMPTFTQPSSPQDAR